MFKAIIASILASIVPALLKRLEAWLTERLFTEARALDVQEQAETVLYGKGPEIGERARKLILLRRIEKDIAWYEFGKKKLVAAAIEQVESEGK